MRRGLGGLLLLVLVSGAAPPDRTVTLVIGGCTDGYLEPCGCGGQQAGGLARRAALVTAVRQRAPGAVYLDLGRLGPPARHAELAAALAARLGAVAVGCGAAEARQPAHLAVARAAALPLTNVAPPEATLPAMVVFDAAPGVRVGVMSICLGPLAGAELAARLGELAATATAEGAAWWVLLSHFDQATTARLLDRLPVARRPAVVALALTASEPTPRWTADGTTWVTVAAKGRSLSVVEAHHTNGRWQCQASTELVIEGPRDDVVQGWVDACFAAQKVTESGAPTPPAAPAGPTGAACAECHAATVAAWRQHPHGRAVATLEALGRDVAACLRCHDEDLRQRGVRGAGADRGVHCLACHPASAAHLQAATSRPGTISVDACTACHTPDHSPHWQPATYLAQVAAVCRAGH
ncbi:MAG: hypothetical protein IT204_14130 [Fimbriimonadaceae bacterium]|nr:hypothetical protein [Fimbriimonadaceae bacterium]